MVLTQAQQIRMDLAKLEMEEKSQNRSLKWFQDNYQKIYEDPFRSPLITPKNAGLLYQQIKEIRRSEFEREQKQREEDKKRDEEFKKTMAAFRQEADEKFEERKGVMFPVPEEVKKLIYNGVSQAGEGKYLYLKVRNELAPYQKYQRKVTTTQNYGWKIEERAERPMKDHCRLSVIQASFYRRFGAIRPDSITKNPPFTSGQVTVPVL